MRLNREPEACLSIQKRPCSSRVLGSRWCYAAAPCSFWAFLVLGYTQTGCGEHTHYNYFIAHYAIIVKHFVVSLGVTPGCRGTSGGIEKFGER
jgi:hypothetical protein